MSVSPHVPPQREHRPVSELVSDLSRQSSELVRQEVALARAELNEKIHQMETGVKAGMAGSVVTHAGVLVLLFAAVFGLATVMAAWVAALIVGAVATIGGAIALGTAKAKLQARSLTPDQTVTELRQTGRMFKESVR